MRRGALQSRETYETVSVSRKERFMTGGILPLSGASHLENRSTRLSYPVPQPHHRRACRPPPKVNF